MSQSFIVHAVLAVLWLGLGWWRLQSPDLRRPFEVDELLTIRYYTWAGIGPSGEPRRLEHIADFYSLPAPTAGQLAMGIYCSAGRWPEPNNHIVNSLLIDAALALGGRDEWSARVPALLGGLVFAAALYYLCGPVLGWRAAAPLAALWAWFHPYVMAYSQTARGYTWMLALQVVQIILAYRMTRTRRPLAFGTLGVATAVLSLLNVVSMAVDWVLPFYLTLLWDRPGSPGAPGTDPAPRGVWRRYVMAQTLAVGGMGAIFLVSHLASVYSAARQYGLPFDSPAGLVRVALGVAAELFPGALDKGLALLGVVGLVALLRAGERHRFLRRLVALTLGVNLLHYVVSGRFPYARAAGHVVPLVLLGAAYLAEAAIRLYDTRAGRVTIFGMLALLTLFLAIMPPARSLVIPALSQRLALAHEVEPPPGSRVFLPIRDGLDYIVAAYGPRSWDRTNNVDINQQILILLFNKISDDANGLEPGFPALDLVRIPGRTQPLAEGAIGAGVWIFWYPDFLQLGPDAGEQYAYVQRSGCAVLPQHERYQVKLDIVSSLQCFIFVPGTETDASKCAGVVREGIRRFGGRAVVFVPSGS